MPANALQNFFDEIRSLPEFVGLGNDPVSVDTRGLFGDTPLHVAAVRGDARIIGLLLDAGADIDAHGENGYTPLQEAVSQDHLDAVQLLLRRGASQIIQNEFGDTAKDIALESKQEIKALFCDNP